MHHLPWLDIAIAVPSAALWAESGIKADELSPLAVLSPRKDFNPTWHSFAFGVTERFDKSGHDKNPGFRRFNQGNLTFAGPPERALLYTPITLENLKSSLRGSGAIDFFDALWAAMLRGTDLWLMIK